MVWKKPHELMREKLPVGDRIVAIVMWRDEKSKFLPHYIIMEVEEDGILDTEGAGYSINDVEWCARESDLITAPNDKEDLPSVSPLPPIRPNSVNTTFHDAGRHE